jgi:hypothetical protein
MNTPPDTHGVASPAHGVAAGHGAEPAQGYGCAQAARPTLEELKARKAKSRRRPAPGG